jgi:class 3 adenylate cyclase/tetratricopeptide (TPR) repeat protein
VLPFRCASCGADNRAGRRFCAQCGAALTVACAACGYANEPGERFCGGCGGALAAAPATAAAPSRAEAGDAERRPVTVLFADLCGYTRLSQSLDPEDVHAVLERYFGVVDAIVERFGGRVDKHIGDAVMAIFGAPVAHGDEPARAVRAAEAIQRAMSDVGSPLGRALAAHVGIAAGEVVASGVGTGEHRAYTVIGPSVNLASRLVDVAGPGEIVLDDAVHDAVAREATCTPLDALAIRGIDRPVTAWRLDALGVRGDAGAPAPFVGRVGELAQLTALIRACAAGTAGSVVHVRGDPGIGKSRLVAELARIATVDGFACHAGLVLDFGTAKGRDPIRDVVASLVALVPTSSPDERMRALETVIGRDILSADARAPLADLLDLPTPPEGRELYAAMDHVARHRAQCDVLVTLVEAAARDAPVLITVEDLHWADGVTLGYVSALARATTTMRALLVLTSRVDGDPLSGGFRASLAGAPLVTLDLAPLSDTDAATLAGGLVATSARFARKCIERAGGNPLFLEQLLRAAEESEDRLPASLASLVLARVDRLPERERSALRAAAVIGQRFPRALVRQMIAAPDYDCTALLAASLVRPDGEEFLFAHALIRDGVYASLTRPRRAELHRAAAAWYGERDPTLNAEHLDRAEAPEAARAYLAAARAQSTELHPERALALAERGAALAREPADVVALNLLCGRLRFDSGEGKPSIEAYERALACATEPGDRCRAWLGIAAGHRLLANFDAAFAALDEALPLARANALVRERAELHYTRGNLHFARSEAAACRAEHAAALGCALEAGDPAWEARATSGLADADYMDGRMRSALSRFTQCVALCERRGLARISIPNRVMMGNCRAYLAEFDAGVADMRAARAIAAKVGDRHGEMLSLESEGLLLVLCDRVHEAVPVLECGLALAEAIGARRYQATLLSALAEAEKALGRPEHALAHVEQALALSRATDMRFCGPMILAVKAALQSDGNQREACRNEAEALLARTCVGHNAIAYHRCGIEDTLARGEWARARGHAEALKDYTRAEPLPYTDFLIARARALAVLGEDPGSRSARAEVDGLRREAERVRWRIGWPAFAAS